MGAFEKLCTVVPEFYTHTWIKLSEKRDYSLLIDVPANIDTIVDSILQLTHSVSPQSKLKPGNVEPPSDHTNANEKIDANTIASKTSESKDGKGPAGPLCQVMAQRSDILHERLITLTGEEHTKYLETIGEKDFDPYEHNTWHHLFKLHELDIANPIPLPERPSVTKCQSVSEFLKQHNVKDQLVREALESAMDSSKTSTERVSTTVAKM